MILIHARSYAQALNHARRCVPPMGYTEWNYVTAENMRGLMGMKMIILDGAENHEQHEEIMQRARMQQFEVVKP